MKKSANQTIYAIWIDRKHAMVMKTTTQGEPEFIEIKSAAGRERFSGETTNKTGMLGTSIDWQKKMQENKLLQGIPLKNRAFRKITKRELELEMEKEFSLHLD
jgi:hypothetical protein